MARTLSVLPDSVKYRVIAICLVPLFYLFINPHPSDPQFFSQLLQVTRLGVEFSFFHWVLTVVIRYSLSRIGPKRLAQFQETVWFSAIEGLFALGVTLFIVAAIEPVFSGGISFKLSSLGLGFLLGGITFLLFTFYFAYRSTREQNLRLRAESAETSVNVLKNQMQPHFLFNSLNSLAELIESNKELASAMTQKLADLYREILENSKTPLATVAKEVSIIEKYLDLERLRFGKRLQFSVDADPASHSALMPSLVLQTLVENAVKHGVAPSPAGGHVSVRVSPAGGGFHAEIENTGAPIRESGPGGTGIKNTVARLDLLYGSRHQFEISASESGTCVQFWFSGADCV